ncbi:AbrB/MazE/SpoVT family DNA-binding domain-containing protein [Chitinimonas koreensis]|uniref:AbrB/MazE/SpoVT family DNA-binding domain-containing protein n=1 Tax=Chitinimonas koreensis TaxID=356302 RepID=UPI0003F89390|nr:type II toxin-antitoxin system PrlF family antitoxin [Chitinimonas koreensis]QNM97557.1 type II toxin-antitoxin system PrlF family antitoxin [Chitinimonas koreensis]
MYTATVTSKGQTTIPAELRERLGIEPGTKLVFTVLPDGRVVMRVKNRSILDLAGMLGSPPSGPKTLEQMDAEIGIDRGR